MTSIFGELFKAGKGVGQEMRNQVFGKPKKENKQNVRVSIHYHFYREKKKPRRKPPGLWG